MQVLVTARAEKNFDSIVNYIQRKWGHATAHQFIQKIDETLTLLEKHPAIGRTENHDIRGFQVTPQTRILYRVKANKIVVLAFFDVRQDPKKKNL
jgi:plasmid stabilization system protein ParE